MPTVEKELKILNKYGLHARPVTQLVELANNFNSKIEISNTSLTVDAKSIMSVMRLAGTAGMKLKILADGADAQEAVDALSKLFEDGFGEMEQDAAEESRQQQHARSRAQDQ